jgi:hypothetical protein
VGNTLPVTITRFEGVMAGTAVNLSWDVESEVDMQAYVVERSGDGHSFTGVGTVAALNAPGSRRYEFTDQVAGLTSKIYYRLRQVNLDGTYRNSKIIWLTTGQAFKVQVYPNPTSGDVSLYVSSETNADITINLRNALGNLVYRRTAKVNRGGNVFSLATAGLQKGVYYVELTSARQQHKTSLLVQ